MVATIAPRQIALPVTEARLVSRPRLPLIRQRWVSPVALLVLWEIGSRIGFIPSRVLAAPSTVAETFWGLTVSGELPYNLLVSLGRASAGLAIGVALGIVLALGAGLSRRGEAMIDPLVQIKRTIPTLALTPLFIIWFGIGEQPKILLIAFATVFPVYLNLFNGIRSVDVRLIEAARTLGLSRIEIVTNVVLPGAMPSLLVGLRYALGVAVLVLVVAEQINAASGLGALINHARDFMQTDVIVVCVMVYAILGLTADLAVRRIETKVLAWRPSMLNN
jgi:sulfonate transport system permease protein